MGKLIKRSDEQALNSLVPNKWEAIRTVWGSAAETGPPEVIDFSESNDANVAVNLDVTDTRQLLIYALGHWVYTFTDVATPIGYNGTWLDAGGEYSVYADTSNLERGGRAQWMISNNHSIIVPSDAKFFNYRPIYSSGHMRTIIVVKT